MINSIRSAILWVTGVLAFALSGAIILAVTFIPPEVLRFRVASRAARFILFSLGAPLRVEGAIPDDRAYIVMANHASLIDPIIMGALLPGKFTAVLATESLKYPIWRTIVKRFRVITIKRKDRQSAIASIGIAEQRLHSGYHVAILPEGTRTLTGVMGPMKKGGFYMAMNTKTAIVPVGIIGAFRFKSKLSWHLRPGTIRVQIGEPVLPEQIEHMEMPQLMDLVRYRLQVLSGEIDPHTS